MSDGRVGGDSPTAAESPRAIGSRRVTHPVSSSPRLHGYGPISEIPLQPVSGGRSVPTRGGAGDDAGLMDYSAPLSGWPQLFSTFLLAELRGVGAEPLLDRRPQRRLGGVAPHRDLLVLHLPEHRLDPVQLRA